MRAAVKDAPTAFIAAPAQDRRGHEGGTDASQDPGPDGVSGIGGDPLHLGAQNIRRGIDRIAGLARCPDCRHFSPVRGAIAEFSTEARGDSASNTGIGG